MAADALPAPTTTTRPVGRGGRKSGTRAAGEAALTAASNIALKRWRGSMDIAVDSKFDQRVTLVFKTLTSSRSTRLSAN
jgi:hypothetical protein